MSRRSRFPGKIRSIGGPFRFETLRLLAFVVLALGFFAMSTAGSEVDGGADEDGDRGKAEGRAAAIMKASATVETCAECHEIDGPGYARNPHAVLNRDPALAAHYGVDSSCNACHGDATEHIETAGEDGTIFGFGDALSPIAKAERCLDCHADAHPRFFATAHAQAGMDCTSCHSIHADGKADLLIPPSDAFEIELASRIGASSASCASCHGAELVDFEWNERHRLHEGSLACVDCHSPHEPSGRGLLGGFGQQACVDCHQSQGGPFVFEHGSQVVEGCVACHSPHGSPNRHLLHTQTVADLCYSCHAAVPGFHTRFTSETICTNCHVTIHGSNFHAGFLK